MKCEPRCPLPLVCRKWRHRLYICDCGQGWRLAYWFTASADGYEWERWPL